MKLYFYGHEMVSQPKYPLVENRERLQDIRDEMVGMMKRHGFNGLSAPQIGVMLQVIVIRQTSGGFIDLVNPVIKRMYGAETEMVETCISCPPRGNGCKVSRMQIIHVMASSVLYPEDIEMRFLGEEARIIQHEMDHLEGTFFFQRASIKDRVEVVQRFKNWKQEWKSTNERAKQ